MRQYKETIKETKEVDKIICNRCKKVIPVIAGAPAEDVLQVEKLWGYFSKKDNRRDCFDLCEECYDELTESFQIPVHTEVETETI
ncbi:MAG: hypothetical protein ACI4D9_06375 [Lachnospiraceae bacterium]